MSGWISIGIDNVLIDVIIEYNSNNRSKSCVLSCLVGSMADHINSRGTAVGQEKLKMIEYIRWDSNMTE